MCFKDRMRNCSDFVKEKYCSLCTRVDLHTPKMVIIQFHASSVWKNACHTVFIQFLNVWHCKELYDKKFFINGNCMIRSFGQPG